MWKFVQLIICLMLIANVGSGQTKNEKPDTLVDSGYDQKEMDTAIAKAKAELPKFLAKYQKTDGEKFHVKIPVMDPGNGKTEHFWCQLLKHQDRKFTARIDNEPGLVTNVKNGQTLTVAESEISDWMFMKQGKMYGNFTMKPLLKTLPKEEADFYRSIMAELE
jgi:uncharacterized protein YegJ (DUF2314 family)